MFYKYCIVTSVMLSHNFNEQWQSRLVDAIIVAWLFYVCLWNNMYNHVTCLLTINFELVYRMFLR